MWNSYQKDPSTFGKVEGSKYVRTDHLPLSVICLLQSPNNQSLNNSITNKQCLQQFAAAPAAATPRLQLLCSGLPPLLSHLPRKQGCKQQQSSRSWSSVWRKIRPTSMPGRILVLPCFVLIQLSYAITCWSCGSSRA